MKNLLHASTLMACAMATLPVQAEVSASVDIANLYLFRGLDLSNGSPAVAGALNYEHKSGLHAGIWGTSGDDTLGSEVNYYVGYQGHSEDLNYSLNYLNYYYPKSKGGTAAIVDRSEEHTSELQSRPHLVCRLLLEKKKKKKKRKKNK